MGIEPQVERHLMPPGNLKHIYADISKARALLGYEPDTPIEEDLEKFADWAETYYAERPVEV